MASTPTPPGGGGMTGYLVTPDSVSQAATYVDTRATEINAHIAALRSYVVGLGGYWRGSAHNAFDTLMTDYDVYARMLHDALSDIASGLRGNYVNYADSEQTNLGNIVKVDLPAPNFG